MFMSRKFCLAIVLSYGTAVTAHQDSVPKIPTVDFVQSMICTARYTHQGVIDLPRSAIIDWQDYARLYEQFIVTDRCFAQQERIPKIIHHIWLGSPLPDRCTWFMETWKKHNPDWLFILWDDARVAQLRLVNQKAYDIATNYGEKSDIARYEILYRFGGLYIDTDFECLQSFDALHHCCDFYTGASVNSGGGSCTCFNGLLASVPGHPILKRCIEGILHHTSNGSNDSSDIMNRTGPYHFTRCLNAAIAAGDDIGRCVPFPPTYFYAWPGAWRFNRNRDFIEQFIRPESLAIHHWASSWL